MTIELKPSRHYPGRTALEHKTYPGSNMTTILDLTPEDIEELVQALTDAGHIKPQPKKQDDEEMIVYGYTVVDRNGKLVSGGGSQEEALKVATEWTKDAKEAGIDWDYRVAAIVDQGGL